MNYYLANTSQWDLMDKIQIEYRHKSLDGTQILVITSQLCEEYLFKFESVKTFMLHTHYTTDEWFGDGGMLEMWELTDVKYIEEIDGN
jgi:hypothetical protein